MDKQINMIASSETTQFSLPISHIPISTTIHVYCQTAQMPLVLAALER